MAIVMEIDEQVLAAKFETILPHLDERQRRLLLAAEARWLGYGGVSLVARAAGGWPHTRVADRAGARLPPRDPLDDREPRGDPMTRLRWTTRSTRNLAAEL